MALSAMWSSIYLTVTRYRDEVTELMFQNNSQLLFLRNQFGISRSSLFRSYNELGSCLAYLRYKRHLDEFTSMDYVEILCRVRLLPVYTMLRKYEKYRADDTVYVIPRDELTRHRWSSLLNRLQHCDSEMKFMASFTHTERMLLFNRFLQINDPPSKRGRLFISMSDRVAGRMELILAGFSNSIEPSYLELVYRYELWKQLCFYKTGSSSNIHYLANLKVDNDWSAMQDEDLQSVHTNSSSDDEEVPPILPPRR